MSRRRVMIEMFTGLVLVLSGCGHASSGSGVATTGTPTLPRTPSASSVPSTGLPSRPTTGTVAPSPTGRTAAPTVTGTVPAPTWSVAPRRVASTMPGTSTVVALRVGHNTGGTSFDRVTIEFHGGVPGYDVRYVPQVRSPGEGRVVPLRGRACLEVVLSPAAAHDAAGTSTLRSPQSGGGLPTLVQYRVTGDFEGYVHLGLGIRERVAFRVLALSNPPRLAIDLAG